jgi:hypothetical protein
MYLFTRFGLGRALLVAAVAGIAFSSCVPMMTTGWSSTCQDAGWASVPISEKVDYNVLYDDVVSLVSRKYEIEMLSKESGYIRTKWNNRYVSEAGQMQIMDAYRTRVSIKLSPQKSKIEVNSEAEKLISGNWAVGCDTRVLETMKKDLLGLSGY